MVSKMSSLMDLVSQNQPHFQTHQALLVIGMQNDFIQPDGRLPVSSDNGYLDRIQTLIPKFRKLNGNVIWVQTLYQGDRIANDASTGEGDALVVGGLIDGDESGTDGAEEDLLRDLPPEKTKSSKHKQRALDLLKRVSARRKTLPREVARATVEQDDELFLLKSEKSVPACVPDTHGAQFADVIAMQFELPADMVIRTTNYSAFQGTSLLMTLRAKLVTELYICGCITNVSVLATVIDAARHGVKINVIEDCLGYRKQNRHELALRRMDEFFDAYLVNSTEILAREPSVSAEKKPTSPSGSRKGSKSSDKALEAMAGRLSLNDAESRPSSHSQGMRSPTKVLTGGQRQLSLVSVAENRKVSNSPPTITEPTDGEFADNLVRGATVPGAADRPQNGEKQEAQLVTKKIRMRSKGKRKKKKTEGETLKEEVELAAGKGEASASASHGPAEAAQPSTTSPVPITPSASEAATSLPKVPETELRRGSLLSRAESVLNLREKMSKPQPLKSVASQPVLSTKTDSREKEKDRDSWSDRMRMSLSRTPKSESTSDSKNRLSYISSKAPSTPSKAESRRTSIAATIAEVPLTPSKVTEPSVKETSAAAQLATPTKPPADSTTTNANMGKCSKLESLANLPTLGPGDIIGEGDSQIIHDFFPPDLKHPSDPVKPFRDVVFTQLYNEVRWQKMLHQQGEVPRLVCCQGEFGDDGSMPVYRHPSDQSLPLLHFSPKVQAVRKRAEELVGHTLNHVLIQLYRSGSDYISEHSDKTLDIVKGSSIVNVSFGAQRTMRLRTKKASKSTEETMPEEKKENNNIQRTTQRIHLPHNSLFVLGLATNATWLHGIQPDKRIASERSPTELAYNGIRISLTFRHIGTFLDARESVIWGQGATEKEQRDAADVINNDESESSKMIHAFSRENHSPDFSWDEHYSGGFDVLHLHAAPPDLPVLFASNNVIETAQARLCLWESKVAHTLIEAPSLDNEFELDRQVAFRDTDALHTEVVMSSNILMYLDRYYPLDSSPHSRHCTAAAYATIVLTAGVLKAWMNYSAGVPTYLAEFKNLLAVLEDKVKMDGGPYVAGRRFSIADCYLWPVVDEVVADWDEWDEDVYPTLVEWWRMAAKKKACVKKLREEREKKLNKKDEQVEDAEDSETSKRGTV
jgi:nicotinamidase-related amidase/alkylated DNA repair dioxygenase AlkB